MGLNSRCRLPIYGFKPRLGKTKGSQYRPGVGEMEMREKKESIERRRMDKMMKIEESEAPCYLDLEAGLDLQYCMFLWRIISPPLIFRIRFLKNPPEFHTFDKS